GLTLAGADAGNYTVNSTATTTADISKAQPLLTLLSSPTIIQGEVNTTLSGKLAAGTLVPPGSVGITIGSGGSAMTMSANVDASTGAFSATFGTATLPANSFGIAYSYT